MPITQGHETITAARVCTKCGATILAGAPRGFCSVCLFKTGLHDLVEENGETAAPPRMGAEFGDYQLEAEIGRGGQGVVYRARQKSLNRTVALKMIGLGQWATEAHLKRFRREAEATAGLDNPCIVPIYEIGERDACCYFTMKLIEGGPLEGRRMPSRRAAELIAKLARAVHHAHEHGVLHRDLKPGNILLDRNGEPHLTDFGLARLVETGNDVTRTVEGAGTPSYMAPEQATGDTKAISPATDVYGLGAVLYHLLTGQPPFMGATTYEMTRMAVETEPRRPRVLNGKVDRDLETICLKCLEKASERRYGSALELAEDLERWLRHEPVRARAAGPFARGYKLLRRNLAVATVVLFSLSVIAVAALISWKNRAPATPANGIAVLPFANLGDPKDAIADGVQDDILTKLAKIADLKVISRTSVMSYRGAQDVRQIGRALNVSHVLEGSVRRDGERIHLNAQLIDTRNDRHVWAEQYDRELKDTFAVQNEIARNVAEQLHAQVSSAEKLAMERPSTADIAAFELLSRARNIFLRATNSNSGREELLEAADLLKQALARDHSYFEAYCQLAAIHDLLYLLGHDHSPRRLASAEAAINEAVRLQPDAGETHLARAIHFYSGYLNYKAALTELELARTSLPNNCRVFELAGLIKNRQGKFREALPELEHAVLLDPRNVYRYEQLALSYWSLGDYRKAAAAYDRALEIEPNNVQIKAFKADSDFAARADTRAFRQLVTSLRESNPRALHEIADSWILCALAERDPVAAKAALIAAGENTPLNDHALHFSRAYVEGWIARLEKDEGKARAAFEEARREQAKMVEGQPDYAPALCVLGAIDAALGQKEEALRECRRAVELLPVEKDVFNGTLMLQWYAASAALLGEKDLALEQLTTTGPIPVDNYGALKLLPFWDPLRGDPRFEQIVASLAPK